MAHESEEGTEPPDSAAVFASALSLWQSCQKQARKDASLNLSEAYNGMDQFMREVMRVANSFEAWSCLHINFDELNDVWPYFLKDKFGEACLRVMLPGGLAAFDSGDCLRVAIGLRLPIKIDGDMRIPINLTAINPAQGSAFQKFRIQTVRDSIEDDHSTAAYVLDDNPFDPEFGAPYFGLYGVGEDGRLEHIADRASYSEAVSLAKKLAPGVEFPVTLTFTGGF